jgi:hypothetical protein
VVKHMAKKKASAVNKSQCIREYHKTHPKHKPKQIAEELDKQGVQVTAQFVSTILSTSKKKRKIGKPGRPKGSGSRQKRARRAAGNSSGEVSFDSLLKIKSIVDEMGGIEEARSALAALERLVM